MAYVASAAANHPARRVLRCAKGQTPKGYASGIQKPRFTQ